MLDYLEEVFGVSVAYMAGYATFILVVIVVVYWIIRGFRRKKKV